MVGGLARPYPQRSSTGSDRRLAFPPGIVAIGRISELNENSTCQKGKRILSVWFPFGELIAAARATGAGSVFSKSSEAPTSCIVPLMLPVALLALRSSRLRRSLIGRLARMPRSSDAAPRPSWAGARATWSDGSEAEAWFRTEDGTDFTIAPAAEVTLRLLSGNARAGASTPGELSGTQIAIAVEAEISPLRDLSIRFFAPRSRFCQSVWKCGDSNCPEF